MERYDELIEVEKRYDEIEEVRKFNPYHGYHGYFSTANGATSMTIRTKDPSKQHMADMAIDRAKNGAASSGIGGSTGSGGGTAKRLKGDPATIAGKKPGNPMTRQDADEGKGNPKIYDFEKKYKEIQQLQQDSVDAWKKYGQNSKEYQNVMDAQIKAVQEYNSQINTNKPYRENCQSCVVAFEARLRGYDVEAKAWDKNNKDQVALSHDQTKAWIDPATGQHPKMLRNDPKTVKTAKQMEKWLDQNVKTGERYTFEYGKKKTDGRNGHIVSMDRDSSGNLRIFDPQNGKTYTGADVTDFIKEHVKGTWNPTGTKLKGRLGLLRIDNLQIDESMANAVLKGGGTP